MATDITWRTTVLPDAIIGAPYEASLAVTGAVAGALSAATPSPALPTGLAMSADKARITGTPTGTPTQWSGTITLADSPDTGVASGTLTMNVRYAVQADAALLGSNKCNAEIAKLQWS